MGLKQRLHMKQGQSLVMTPQLQQAIKLLQMSNIELQSFVESELEKNPLLEREDNSPNNETGNDGDANIAVAAEPSSLDETLSSVRGAGDDSPTSGAEPGMDDGNHHEIAATAPGPGLDSGWSSLRQSSGLSIDGEAEDAASRVTREETLSEHLTRQLNLYFRETQDRAIGQYLIGMINEAGYLNAELPQVAEGLGTSLENVERVLKVMRGFDPVGVFSSDLKDCLKAQLVERNHFDEAMAVMIDNLQLVAKRDYQQLRSLCAVSMDDIQDMIAELKTLNPKPGLAFGSEPVAAVVPDVFVRASTDGSWIVELNSETLPRVLVNTQYMTKVSRGAAKADDTNFLAEAHAQATWLVKSLDQRARTILKVAREIVSQQDGFLIHGIQHMRPITLKTVAEAIEMHESTISRVTSNKYMSTPRGVFELKFFFSNAISSSEDGAESHAAESVRHRIREMISRETVDDILSDDTIVEKLKADGIDIARRTVAKYRESLGIQSSVQRRREAKIRQ
jgi:RNA polymerase sigma-54 factor